MQRGTSILDDFIREGGLPGKRTGFAGHAEDALRQSRDQQDSSEYAFNGHTPSCGILLTNGAAIRCRCVQHV